MCSNNTAELTAFGEAVSKRAGSLVSLSVFTRRPSCGFVTKHRGPKKGAAQPALGCAAGRHEEMRRHEDCHIACLRPAVLCYDSQYAKKASILGFFGHKTPLKELAVWFGAALQYTNHVESPT